MKPRCYPYFTGCLVMLTVFGCGGGTPAEVESSPQAASASPDAGPQTEETEASRPVHAEVTAFVLTKCPYAAELMRNLVALRREMGSQLDVSIGYIGLVDGEGNIDPGMAEAERRTATLQVCVSAESTAEQWFDYLGCVYDGDGWRTLPAGWERCVSAAGISVDEVRICADSGNGETILAQAYGAAMASRVSGSPTVFINGFLYGQERTLATMKQYICHVAGDATTRPAACDGVPEPPKIQATLVYDPRCAALPMCDVEGEIAVLERLIPGFVLDRVPFSREEGRALYEAVQAADIKAQKLPLVIVKDPLDAQESLKSLLGEYLLPFGDGFVFALGGGWDPLAEICDNEIDDNDDGKVDCDDAACGAKLHCRDLRERRLDLFAMSECPFALELLPTVNQLLDHFGRDDKKIDFNLQFIGDVGNDGTLLSMHGQSEVDEDLRMLCVQSLYRKNYKYMDYVLCRAKSADAPAWESCVHKGMSRKKIEACASGKKGRALLEESFALADSLGITGSPSWILNNKEKMFARQLGEIVTQYCARNPVAECDTAVTEVPADGTGPAAPAASCQ